MGGPTSPLCRYVTQLWHVVPGDANQLYSTAPLYIPPLLGSLEGCLYDFHWCKELQSLEALRLHR